MTDLFGISISDLALDNFRADFVEPVGVTTSMFPQNQIREI
jgi:hypothetical protein